MTGVARILFERRSRREPGSPDFVAADMQTLLNSVAGPISDDLTGEYRPSIDVIETSASIEITADLPGIVPDDLRVAFNDGLVILAGRKRASACQHAVTFHLAERTFGRFAVGIRVAVAVDLSAARAVLRHGELHISLPRIAERRRSEVAIPIERA